MKSHRLLACVAGCVAVGAMVAWAQPEPGQAPKPPEQPRQDGRGEGRARGSGEVTSVEGAMKLINRSMRRLSQQIDDPEKKQENLQLLGDIERAAVTAKSMPVPEKRAPRGEGAPRGRVDEHNEAPMPAAQNEKQPQGAPAADPQREETYRRDLMQLIRQALDVEQDLMDGKNDQAKADLKKIGEIRNGAHKELGVKLGRD